MNDDGIILHEPKTEWETVLKCQTVWMYVHKNPGVGKISAYRHFKMKADQFWCPACSYVKNVLEKNTGEESNCQRYCPINWGKYTRYKYPIKCTHNASPFMKWWNTNHKYKLRVTPDKFKKKESEIALKIVFLCDDAIKRLREKKDENNGT